MNPFVILQMNKKSLTQEVAKLKSLLDAAAAATSSGGDSKSNGNVTNDNDEEEDMDISFMREEVAAQKEIIIARDQVIHFKC